MDTTITPSSLNSANDDRLLNVVITTKDLEALLAHLQELNSARAYHGTYWFSIPEFEEPDDEAYAQKGYDTCLEDVVRYLKESSIIIF